MSQAASAVEILENAESSSISPYLVAVRLSMSTRVTASYRCEPPNTPGRCRCKKNNVIWSVLCRSPKFDCGILSSLRHRTVIAFVPVLLAPKDRRELRQQLRRRSTIQTHNNPIIYGWQWLGVTWIHKVLDPQGIAYKHRSCKDFTLLEKAKTNQCPTLDIQCRADEVVTHLIATELGIQYVEALNVLTYEVAWEYGEMIDNWLDYIKMADLYIQPLE